MSSIKFDSASVDAVMKTGFYGYYVTLIAMSVGVTYIGLAVALYLLVICDWE